MGTIPPPDYLLTKGVKQLTFEGENDSAHFSADGNKVIYLSRRRLQHKNTQIYEMNLQKNTERRVTFQDGEVSNPIYLNDQQIIYASNTDEIKENLAPSTPKNTTQDYLGLDIYRSDLFGNDIDRLTHVAGYDDEPVVVTWPRPHLIFTSRRDGASGLFKYDFKTNATSVFLFDKNKDQWGAAVSPSSQHIAWLEKEKSKNTFRIMLSPLKNTKPVPLKEEETEFRDLHFIPNTTKLIYAAKQKGQDLFHIEVFDFKKKKCTQVLFSGRDSLVQPSVSFNGLRILMTRILKDTRQVYIVDYPEKIGPCLEPTP